MSKLVKMAIALLWAGVSTITYASTTSVTATLTDPDGQTWNNCVWSAVVVSDYPPTIGGVPVPDSQLRANGSCSSSGVLTATMLNTSSVQQNNVTWTFTIQPNASVSPSVVAGIAVTGTSINLSTALSAGIKAPRFGAGPNSYGYADVEINSSSIGNTYFNTGTVCGGPSLRQLSQAGWQCGGSGGGGLDVTGIPYGNGGDPPSVATTTQVNTALGVSNGTFISGDSIACFTGATGIANAFSSLLKNPIGGWWSNNCRPGDQAADQNIKTIFRATYAQGGGIDPVYVTELGTNDAINYLGNTDKQKSFQRITLANLSWQAVPIANRKFAQTCTLAGGFAADNALPGGLASNPYPGLQIVGSTTSATASCVLAAPKANDALYIWYKIADGTTGTFTVSIDGVPQNDPFNGTTTWVSSGDGGTPIATGNTVTTAIAAARFTGLSSGNHTVLITVTSSGQNVWFDGIGFAPASSPNNPVVAAVSPNQQNVSSAGAPYVATYQGFISSIVSNLHGDGLEVYYADTSNALLNDPSCGNGNAATMFSLCYVDAVHPNNTGHAVMANTILAALPAAKKTGANAFIGYTPSKSYTPIGNPLGPLGMLDANPYNAGYSTSYNPGVLFYSGQGQMEYISAQGTTGLTMSTPSGVDISLCHSGGGGYFSPTPPLATDCGYQYKGNGAHQFAGGSSSAAGTTIQPGLLQTGTSVTVTLGGPFSTQSLLGPATAPTGACSPNGKWAFSQDGHATYCNAGTWTTVI